MYYIFTDGSSSRKRFSIGSSYVIYNANQECILSYNIGFFDKDARIGVAELLGVYGALSEIWKDKNKFRNEEIIIYSDSQYVVRELTIWFKDQLLKNLHNTKNKDLILYILYLLILIRDKLHCKVCFEWIKGHQKLDTFEVRGNQEADEQAVKAHDESEEDLYLFDVELLINDLRELNTKKNILEFLKRYYIYGKTNK